jgi:hypothetical protein
MVKSHGGPSKTRIAFALRPTAKGQAPGPKASASGVASPSRPKANTWVGGERNRRRAGRDYAFAICRVMTENGQLQEGVIVDISETGARVRFKSRCRLPETLRIIAPRIQLDRTASLVWQDLNDAGIHFD